MRMFLREGTLNNKWAWKILLLPVELKTLESHDRLQNPDSFPHSE